LITRTSMTAHSAMQVMLRQTTTVRCAISVTTPLPGQIIRSTIPATPSARIVTRETPQQIIMAIIAPSAIPTHPHGPITLLITPASRNVTSAMETKPRRITMVTFVTNAIPLHPGRMCNLITMATTNAMAATSPLATTTTTRRIVQNAIPPRIGTRSYSIMTAPMLPAPGVTPLLMVTGQDNAIIVMSVRMIGGISPLTMTPIPTAQAVTLETALVHLTQREVNAPSAIQPIPG